MFRIVKRKIKQCIYVALIIGVLIMCIQLTNTDRNFDIIKSILVTDKTANIAMVTANMDNITVVTKEIVYPPFQPDVEFDFPTVDGTVPRIPHILHQTYRNEMIPAILSGYVRKLVSMHPDWQYYFWTDESARKLIAERHPELLHTWDHFDRSIRKGDALRYLVLYEFGGAYLDLDVDTLRPLDRVMMKYACIFPTEPFEHAVFLRKTGVFMNNAIMFCRPKHPFLKMLLDNLRTSLGTKDVVESTGPMFVTKHFITYNNINVNASSIPGHDPSNNSPYFYKSKLPETHDDAVYVPNTHYFTDQIDIRTQRTKFTKICNNTDGKIFLIKRACNDMERRGMVRKDKTFRLLTHKWYHLWTLPANKERALERANIRKIVSNCIVYANN